MPNFSDWNEPNVTAPPTPFGQQEAAATAAGDQFAQQTGRPEEAGEPRARTLDWSAYIGDGLRSLGAEAGYGLKDPRGGGALDAYARLSESGQALAWSLGTRYHLRQNLRLGIESSRTLTPAQPGNLGLNLALDLTF